MKVSFTAFLVSSDTSLMSINVALSSARISSIAGIFCDKIHKARSEKKTLLHCFL